MILSHLYLHVITEKEPMLSIDDLSGLVNERELISIEVNTKDSHDDSEDEFSNTIQIPCHWIEQYLEPFFSDHLNFSGDCIIAHILGLIGKDGRKRFLDLIEESFRVADSQLYSSIYKDEFAPIAGGFEYWIEENYLELMKEDSREADLTVVA